VPKQKDLKRLVRTRMKKTGESYTAARAQLTRKKTQPAAGDAPAPDFAVLAGMSDEAIRAKTGCTWETWVYVLDKIGATEMSHRAVAAHVQDKYKLDGWWAQTVTVGYERIRGLRERGQRLDGSYEATKSRTFPVPVDALYAAWSLARTRAKWLPGVALEVRTASANRSMRIGWPDGTHVDLWFTDKGEKSQVAVSHRKLASREDAETRRQFWADRLAALHALLKR